jgi:OOP family OmpA-OmpF porin
MQVLILATLLATGIAGVALAQESAPALDVGAPEGAVSTARSERPFDRYALPVGPHSADTPNLREIEGEVTWSGFRLDATDTSTAEVMAGYRSRLAALGFQPVFDCATTACGGFDFRFGVQLLPAPAMLIDAADFAQFSAGRGNADGTETFVSVLVSRLLGVVHIQTVVVEPGEPGQMISEAPPPNGSEQPVVLAQDEQSLLDQLTEFGHVRVNGLEFETGGAALSEGSTPALRALAGSLSNNPDISVVIVGHSDNQGALDTNIALSKRRAEAVRTALIEHGVAADRLEAHGVGYLAPVSTNLTDAGRTLNRRVELVLR